MLSHPTAHVSYKIFYDTFISVLDIHAPVKERLVRANEVPYMTKKLRKAIANRSRLENNYKLQNPETFLENSVIIAVDYINRKERNFM